jgi:hypothetical protein
MKTVLTRDHNNWEYLHSFYTNMNGKCRTVCSAPGDIDNLTNDQAEEIVRYAIDQALEGDRSAIEFIAFMIDGPIEQEIITYTRKQK